MSMNWRSSVRFDDTRAVGEYPLNAFTYAIDCFWTCASPVPGTSASICGAPPAMSLHELTIPALIPSWVSRPPCRCIDRYGLVGPPVHLRNIIESARSPGSSLPPAQSVADKVFNALERFLHVEAVSGVVLLIAAASALWWANSSAAQRTSTSGMRRSR